MFNAILLSKEDDSFSCEQVQLNIEDLPDHPVEVDIDYSTINYKDGLAITGRPGVVRTWPLVPGIDLAGTIAASQDPNWQPGSKVTINGWDMGEAHWGGLAQKAKVEPGWLTPLPDSLSTYHSAAIGTAGYTAMLCVLALEEHQITPDQGPVVVTGAAGGVGSVAVAVLSKLGYEVVAASGRADTEGDYLKSLGAAEIIHRDEFAGEARPLGSAKWAGAIDAVGSTTLANVISQMQPNGCVAACGLAQGPDLPTSVIPFILRGVTLVGINCVHEPAARRELAWQRLAQDLDLDKLDSMTQEVGLAEVPQVAEDILAGQVRGRTVVNVNR